VAQVAKELGILTVAVVTRPFPFEGPKRMRAAEEGMKELSEYVDSLITIPNEKLLSVLGKNASLLTAFSAANDVLLGAVQGIAELITSPGIINVDFADVRTVMSEMGMAMMGTGAATGENRAREAAEKAIRSPLLEDIDLHGARGILVNITAGPDLSIGEFNDVGATVQEFASQDATIVVGTSIDMEMSDELRVTVVAAGLDAQKEKAAPRETAASRPETTDYRKLQQPAVMRQQAARAEQEAAAKKPQQDRRKSSDMDDYLDIPAFLRRQAD
jgi:cell division protein FtsZ